ncbi:defective proboscis extension response 7 [Carabus blaptoides fortunei]
MNIVLMVHESVRETGCWLQGVEKVAISVTGLSQPGDISKVKFMDTLEPTVGKPYFEDVGPKNVTVVVGESTTLKCRVRHPGDRTWCEYGVCDRCSQGYTHNILGQWASKHSYLLSGITAKLDHYTILAPPNSDRSESGLACTTDYSTMRKLTIVTQASE